MLELNEFESVPLEVVRKQGDGPRIRGLCDEVGGALVAWRSAVEVTLPNRERALVIANPDIRPSDDALVDLGVGMIVVHDGFAGEHGRAELVAASEAAGTELGFAQAAAALGILHEDARPGEDDSEVLQPVLALLIANCAPTAVDVANAEPDEAVPVREINEGPSNVPNEVITFHLVRAVVVPPAEPEQAHIMRDCPTSRQGNAATDANSLLTPVNVPKQLIFRHRDGRA